MTLSKSETVEPIDTKFCTIDYVGLVGAEVDMGWLTHECWVVSKFLQHAWVGLNCIKLTF